MKSKWKAFREWIEDWDTIFYVQLIQGVVIAFLAVLNLVAVGIAAMAAC